MKVHCIKNRGIDLRPYEYERIDNDDILGRFGATAWSEYNGVDIGREYLVMGMMLGKGTLDYLVDDGQYVSAYPYPLFEVIDPTLPVSWFFKALKNTDKKFPYQEAIWGYHELVFDDSHYGKLVDIDKEALETYFRRKRELEKGVEEELEEQAQFDIIL